MYFVCLDNVVLVGNHRDAVGYGAVDPASGTAVVLELARVFQSLASQGITMPHKINKNLSPAVSLCPCKKITCTHTSLMYSCASCFLI